MDAEKEMAEARQRMIARRFAGGSAGARAGGMRRKKKAVHKATAGDDKKLSSTLKKLGVTNIPAIEEVNLFTSDGKVVHFQNPKVQASIAANTYVVSGPNDTKPLSDLLPGIMNQLGADNIEQLKQIADNLGGAGGAPGGAAPVIEEVDDDDDDDDVPDLVTNFEDTANSN